MAKELRVLVAEEELGSLFLERGRIRFVYEEAWRGGGSAFPLSLSMPLAAAEHSGDAVENYLWNLLPDREETLMALARQYSVSSRNPFALVGAHGQDLPGAVQILPPELVATSIAREGVKWVSEKRLAEFLGLLIQNPGLNRINEDANHFSLAGAQPKKAVLWMGGRWYEHKGRTPTTHIIKPPIRDLDFSVENEHFCLRLAAAIGLPTAKSEVVKIDGVPNIVVERYDRVRFNGAKRMPLNEAGGVIYRIHQEDLCQSLGVSPKEKYQKDGGPTMADIMRVLDGSSNAQADRERFMRACAFNFVVLGIDAHAKNFSILIDHTGYRLAPLYEIISAAAYDTYRYDRMAMKVGGEYRWRWIAQRHWERAAQECRFPVAETMRILAETIQQVRTQSAAVLQSCHKAGLKSDFLTNLAHAIEKRCNELAAVYVAA